MPELYIYRAKRFSRGDESVSIWLDGEGIGTLPKEGPLIKEVPPGTHTLQAWMNGAKGKKTIIQASEGTRIDMTLSKTTIEHGKWWEAIAFLLLCFIPDQILSGKGFWIKVGLFIPLIIYSIVGLLKRKRDFLKLEMTKVLQTQEVE